MAQRWSARSGLKLEVPGVLEGPGSDSGLGSTPQAIALATLCVVLFLTFLDNTVVSVGLANIQSDLHVNVSNLQWVVNGYALTFASFMLAAGTLGDRLGRRRIMLGGVAGFCIGSIICAVAPNVAWLIAGRVVMGVGAAASEPGTLSVLRHLYPKSSVRANALGVWAGISGLALALGPVVAGTLVGAFNWRAIFWFNLGLGILAFFMTLVFVPETKDPVDHPFDIPGILFGVGALATLSIAIIQGENAGYATWWVDLLFALSLVFTVVFVLYERSQKSPMLDISLFRRGKFSGSMVVAFATYFGTFSIFFFTALYVQVVTTASPYATALDFIPMALCLIATSVATGPWVARSGPRSPMVAGCFIGAIGLAMTSVMLKPTASFVDLWWCLALAGVGFGMALVPVTSAALGAVPSARSGMAASVTNTSRELGAVLGVAVLGSLVNARLTGQLAARLRAIGIAPSIQSLALHAVTNGGLGGGGTVTKSTHSTNHIVSKIATEVEHAAYAAFGSGLHLSLDVAAVVIAIAGVVAYVTIGADSTNPHNHLFEL